MTSHSVTAGCWQSTPPRESRSILWLQLAANVVGPAKRASIQAWRRWGSCARPRYAQPLMYLVSIVSIFWITWMEILIRRILPRRLLRLPDTCGLSGQRWSSPLGHLEDMHTRILFPLAS